MFAQKLDYIMNLTGTRANILGAACHVDSSHISRLRNGARKLPRNPGFLDDMSAYFASHISMGYQQDAMCKELNISKWPQDEQSAESLIKNWFLGNEDNIRYGIPGLLDSFGTGAARSVLDNDEELVLSKTKRYYYGPSGKREAVLQFFDHILKSNKAPMTLLLFSDEDMAWLYNDPFFAARWAKAFTKVLRAGNKVKIIHNLGRDINELLEAVAKWIPVYSTGMIEPYYYPKLRDGLLQRTLFIAPSCAAVVSDSVGMNTEGMLNEFITDPKAVNALVKEYEEIFDRSKKLMEIYGPQRSGEFWNVHQELASVDADIMLMGKVPTLITMPQWVARSMQDRAPQSSIYAYWTMFRDFFESLSSKKTYTEILPKPDISKVNVPLPCAGLIGAAGMTYTPEEWKAHIENSELYAKTYKYYKQVQAENIPDNMYVIASEDHYAFMIKTTAPEIAFAITESRMISAFCEFMQRT